MAATRTLSSVAVYFPFQTIRSTQIVGSTLSLVVVNIIAPRCTNTDLRFYEIYDPDGTTIGTPYCTNFLLAYLDEGNTSLSIEYIGYVDNMNFVLP